MIPPAQLPDPIPDSLSSMVHYTRLTPWKANNEIRRLLIWPRVRLLFAWAGIAWGTNWRFYGVPLIQRHRASTIRIGDGMELRSSLISNPLGPAHPVILSTRRAGAIIQIGANFGMTGGSICADHSITMGDRVTVGANTIIVDTDFHPLDPVTRQRDPMNGATAPILIEDDVFIGMNCLILKGVRIGQSSVIGAGSIVTRDVPPGVIAAGNPLRIIKTL